MNNQCIARELLAVARELTAGSKLTSRGKEIEKSMMEDYRKYYNDVEVKVVEAILRKYHGKLGDEEFYEWDPDNLKITDSKDSGKEYISIKDRVSIRDKKVDGEIKIRGKKYNVEGIFIDSRSHRL